MTISLDAETQKLLEEQMQQGGYSSVDQVVRAALELLARDQIPPLDAETLDAIDEAEDQAARGETLDWAEASTELRRKYLGKK